MTHPHPPPRDTDPVDPRDELASAHLDGATGPDDAARVAADPELARRVDRLAAARDALRATADDRVDGARREAAVAAALAAFTEAGPSVYDDAPSAAAAPTPLVRPSRSRPRTRTLQLVGIAAAAVLLALTVPLLDRLGSDDRDDTASSSFDATGGSVDPSAEASAGGDGSGGGMALDTAEDAATLEVSSGPDLGAFADLDALRTAVRAQLQTKSSSTTAPAHATTSAASAPSCPPTSEADVVYTARATVAGQPVTVVVREHEDGQRTLVVLDDACATLSEDQL